MADITLRKVVKRYEKNQTIHGVDLQIDSGEFVVFAVANQPCCAWSPGWKRSRKVNSISMAGK